MSGGSKSESLPAFRRQAFPRSSAIFAQSSVFFVRDGATSCRNQSEPTHFATTLRFIIRNNSTGDLDEDPLKRLRLKYDAAFTCTLAMVMRFSRVNVVGSISRIFN